MAENSKISWTNHTFNPWIGCTKVAAGCTNCYAENLMDARYGKAKWGPNGTRVLTSPANWKLPLKWNREAEKSGTRARVFCASLADVFEDWEGPLGGDARCWSDLDDARQGLFALIDATPWLDWLLLTKRPENIRRMWPNRPGEKYADGRCVDIRTRHNCWIGCSVATQADADRNIPELLKCRDLSPVLFVSAEPLVGGIDLSPWIGYKPVYETNQQRRICVPSGDCGRDGNRLTGPSLESGSTKGGSLERRNEADPMQETQGRVGHRRIPSSADDDQRQEGQLACSQIGMETLQRSNSTRADDQSQAWEQEGQPASNVGAGDVCGTSAACEGSPESRESGSGRRSEQQRQADRFGVCGDSPPQSSRRKSESDSDRIRDIVSDSVQNLPWSTPQITWVIAGGESGHNARPCDVAWIRSLVRQCKAAGVACFVKQLGAKPFDSLDICRTAAGENSEPAWRLKDPKGGDMNEWPVDLRVRQFPSNQETTR